MQWLLVLAFSVAVSSVPLSSRDGSCSAADETKTKSCLSPYYSSFGISVSSMPPFSVYVNDYEKILTQFGTGGVSVVCQYVAALDSCLGPLKDSACMQPSGFQQMLPSLDFVNASQYSMEHAVRTWQCGHQDQIVSNLPCLKNVAHNHFGGLHSCAVQLFNELSKGQETCSAFDDFADCMMDLYIGVCGVGVKSFICNSLEVALNFDTSRECAAKLPKCNA